MFLTRNEHDALSGFQADTWNKGDGLWIVDHLACRGLLVRNEIVKPLQLYSVSVLVRSKSITEQFRDQKADRARSCLYRLSRRGERALHKARIVGEAPRRWNAEDA